MHEPADASFGSMTNELTTYINVILFISRRYWSPLEQMNEHLKMLNDFCIELLYEGKVL